jgi:hypothetical protein
MGVAKKQLNQRGLLSFSRQLKEARKLDEDRDEKINELYAKIESNLHIVGATGVEVIIIEITLPFLLYAHSIKSCVNPSQILNTIRTISRTMLPKRWKFFQMPALKFG